MKNRLQFNRLPHVFESREKATEELRKYINPEEHENFIPLIGEPIVVRYLDNSEPEKKRQLMLAIGKSVASGQVEYHVIDTAEINETIQNFSGVVESRFVELSGVVETNLAEIYKLIEDDEEVVSAALNDLNDRINDNDLGIEKLEESVNAVSAYTNGVLTISYNETECGSYSPSANTSINIDVHGSNVPMTGYEVATGETAQELQILSSDTVCEAAGKLQKQIIDDGEVTSAALNDLNDRIMDLDAVTAEKFTELSGVAEYLAEAVPECFNQAEYITSGDKKFIVFMHDGDVKASIDAADFIKDGMVNNVAVVGTNLVITFNTDAGKEDIVIPLSEIFDPSLLDALSASVVDNSTHISAISGDVTELSASVVYNVTKINNVSDSVIDNAEKIDELSGSVVANEIAISALSATIEADEEVTAAALNDLNDRISEVSENAATEADLEELSNRVDSISAETGDFFDNAEYVASAQTIVFKHGDTELDSIDTTQFAATYVSGNGIDITNDTISAKLANKGDAYLKVDADGLYTSGISEAISEIDARLQVLSGVVEDDEETIAAAFNDINDRVGDLEATAMDPDNYYDKNEIDEKLEDISISAGTFDPQFYYTKSNINTGVSASTRELSAATVSHVNNNDIHVTAAQKTAWADGANSGASAWTAVNNLSAATTGIGQDVTNLSAATTGINTSLNTLSGVVESLSSNTVDKFSEVERKLGEISAGTGGDVSALSASVVSNNDKVVELSGACGNYFDTAEYVSSAQTIVFKHGSDIKAQINASGFVKDGMVSAVTITGGNMVISFNTDAGRQDITLALTDIFDPDDYYTKTEVDALSATVVTNNTNITNLSGSVVTNKTDISNMSGSVVNNQTNINNVSGSVVTNKTNITNLSAGTVNLSGDVITYVNQVSGDVVTYVTNLSGDTYNTINKLSGDVVTYVVGFSAGTSVSLDELSASVVTNKTNLDAFSGGIIELEYVMAEAVNDLNSRIIEISGQSVDLSDYYTTAQTYSKAEIMDLFAASGGSPEGAISAITENLNILSGATSAMEQNVKKIAVTAVTINGSGNAVTGATYANSALTLTKGNVGGGTDVSSLSSATVALSAGTVSGLNSKQNTISDLATIRNNANSGASAYTMVKDLSAITLTGVTVNGVAAPVQNGVASITVSGGSGADVAPLSAAVMSLSAAVVTVSGNSGGGADIQPLSSATYSHVTNTNIHVTSAEKTTWNGKQDAISDLATIRNNAASGASAYTGLTQLSGAVVNNYYGKGDVYNKTEIMELFSASGGNPDAAISALTESLGELSGETIAIAENVDKIAVTGVTVSGTGNAVVAATYSNSALTLGKGSVQSEITDLADIRNKANSGASAYTGFIAHSANTNIHVTASEKETWNGKQDAISDLATIRNNANSGASAYTAVTALSAATTAMSANLRKIAVTSVTIDDSVNRANAVTSVTYTNSALTLTMGKLQTEIEDLDSIRKNAASGKAAYDGFIAHSANTTIHVTTADKSNWNGKQDAISDIDTIRNNASSGASAYTGLTQLSGAVVNNYYTKDDVYDKDNVYNKAEIMELFAASGGNPDSAISALTENLNKLSAATESHIGNTDVHVTAADKTTWNGKQDAISDLATIRSNAASGKAAYDGFISHSANTDVHVTAAQKTAWTNGSNSGASAYTMVKNLSASTLNLSAVTLTGVTVNGTAAPVTNHVAAITGVLTAETQLSVASAGTGNVVTNITVNNHKITFTKGVSAASASDLNALSGGAHSKITALSAGTVSGLNGKQATITDLDDIRRRANSGASAYTRVNTLSGAVVSIEESVAQHIADTNIHVTSAEKTTWNGKQDAITDLDTIRRRASSGASAYTGFIAHSANTNIHVTATDKSNWNGKQDAISDLDAIRKGANSGASAWTAVTALSAATTALSTASANYFDGAEYVSSAKTIVFKHGNTVKAQINASGFVKDGMVSSVTISDGNMVITFNTDAGHDDITLPLTSIFNPDNYYTKEQINTGVSATTKALSGSVVSLSAATYSHSGDTTRHITSAERTKWNNGANSGSSAWTAVTALSAATVNIKNNAITAETPVTITKTGTTTGNVIGTISVDSTDNHKINYTLVSAATVAQLVALSASTTAMSANVGKIAVTGVTVSGTGNAVVAATYSNSALTLGKGNLQEVISDLATIRSNAEAGASASADITALSAATTAMSANIGKIAVTAVTVSGSGNAVVAAKYANSALTLGKGNVQEVISDLATIRSNAEAGAGVASDLEALSGATYEHVTDSYRHTTSIQKGEWTRNSNSGASAYTMVLELSAATTAINQTVANALTGVTLNGVSGVVSNNVAALKLITSADTFTTLTGNVVTSLRVSGNEIFYQKQFSAASCEDVVNLSAATVSGMKKEFVKSTPSTTAVSINLGKSLTVLTLTGTDTTAQVSFTGRPTLASGEVRDVHVIVSNTGSVDKTITFSASLQGGTVVCTTGNTLFVEASSYAEFNALLTYDGTNYVLYLITT